MDIRVLLVQTGNGRWVARADGEPEVTASGSTRERCLANFRRSLDRAMGGLPASLTLMIEAVPVLAGVAEAAEVMGWDKRRVVTYIDRGSFPEPIQSLASGRVWLRSDVEAFAKEWRARRTKRLRARRR